MTIPTSPLDQHMPQPPTTPTSNPQDVDAASTASVTPQKPRREGEGDNGEKTAYKGRLRPYDPAAPRVSSFVNGSPFAPKPRVSRRVLPQGYRALHLEAAGDTGSKAASTSIYADRQRADVADSTRVTTLKTQANNLPAGAGSGGNIPPSVADERGPFGCVDLARGSDTAKIPQFTP